MNINAIRVVDPLSQHHEMSCNERMGGVGGEGVYESPGCWASEPLSNSKV